MKDYPAITLALRILRIIEDDRVDRNMAYSALGIVKETLPTLQGIPFMSDPVLSDPALSGQPKAEEDA